MSASTDGRDAYDGGPARGKRMEPAHHYIATSPELAPLAAALAETRELALDTESNSMFAYRE